jgi:hypothetical protein
MYSALKLIASWLLYHNDFEDFKSEGEIAKDMELIKHLKKIRGENG